MPLDTTTVFVIQTLLLFLSGAVFIFDTALSRDNVAGPVWSLAYLLAMLSSLSYTVAHLDPALAWIGAIGDASFVLAAGAIWCGLRRYKGQKAFMWAPALASVVTGIGSYISTIANHGDIGTIITQTLVAVLALLIAGSSFTIRFGRIFYTRVLGVGFTILGGYFLTRAATLTATGSDSDIYERYFGPAAAGLVTILFIAFLTTMLTALRGGTTPAIPHLPHSTTVEAYGTLPTALMAELATETLLRARDQQVGIAVIETAIDDLAEINTAFGRPFGDESIESFAKLLKLTICPLSIISHRGGGTFIIIAPAATKKEANRMVSDLQKVLLDTPLAQMGELRLIASFGIAHTNNSGYNLDMLLEKAHLRRTQSRTPNLNTLAITLPGLHRP